MATRFYAALDAWQMSEQERARAGFWSWWPSRPAWQLALSVACLVLGVFAGSMVVSRRDNTDMNELRKEMAGMRQLVTLSLLQQQSATERLRGVTYSYRAEPNDTEVLSALMQTVDLDPNVDVRLAAVDALRQFKTKDARRGLVDSLKKQESPMVQIAIIDALAELKERSAAPAMRALLTETRIDENVRKRVESVLNTFQ
jgi:HEAT repeat protein